MNFGTLFSGFGGADIGMMAAGLTPAWGVELDPRVADVANANLGNHIITANVLDMDPATLEPVYALHASPPCTRASVANSRAETNEDGIREAPLDIALAEKVIQFVETLQPQIVTLENVWQYRQFQSWKGGKKTRGIAQALWDLGYWVAVEHVNAADFGVPQTRKRMIVRAIRGGMVPHLPQPGRWIGWYEAIHDILDTLPPSEFAPWQLERLPATIGDVLLGNTAQGDDRAATTLDADRPAMTIQSWHDRRPSHMPSAFLLGNGTRSAPQAEDAPADTVTSNSNQTGVRAFLVGIQNSGGDNENGRGVTVRMDDQAIPTMRSERSDGWRAFLIGDHAHHDGGLRTARGDFPAHTLRASRAIDHRAFLLSSNTVDGGAPAMRDAADPGLTVDTKTAGHLKSWLAQGRVVSMTPRALARFQSFPDWYVLPESKTLACLGIGNAVPPLLMQTVYEQLMEANQP